MRHIFLPILTFFALVAPIQSQITLEQIMKMAPAEIEKALPNEHPAMYYQYAARLFAEGKKDDAVFWFYAGQLRYRIHLLAKSNIDPSGDPALFASLNSTIGQTINEYAGGNIKDWVASIDKALKWDAETPDGFTAKKEFAKERKEIRDGLSSMRDNVLKNADQLRKTRIENGLKNRN